MGSISSEQTDPDRAGGGDPIPAIPPVTDGADAGGRAPAGGDRDWGDGWLLALALSGVLALWLLVRPFGERVTVVVSNLANLAGPLVACWVGLRRRRRRGPLTGADPSDVMPAAGDAAAGSQWRRRVAGGNASVSCLVAAGLLCAAAQFLSYGAQLLTGRSHTPGWINCVYFLAYPCLIAGVLLLPLRRKSLLARGRAVSDAAMAVGAFATLVWYYVLGPILVGAPGAIGPKLVALAYPVGDLMVLCGLLVVCLTAAEPADDRTLRRVVLPLAVGLAALAIADCVAAFQVLAHTYHRAQLLHALWPLGYMLLGVAGSGLRSSAASAQMLRAADDAGGQQEAGASTKIRTADGNAATADAPPATFWRAALPYVPLATVGIVLVVHHQSDHRSFSPGVAAGAMIIGCLAVLRQLLDAREYARLYARLRGAFKQLDESHQSLTDANESLALQTALLESQNDSSPDGILVATAAGEMVSFNRRFVQMWGLPEDIAESRGLDAALEASREKMADPDAFVSRVMHMRRNPDERALDELQLKDGRTFECHTAPLYGAGGACLARVCYFRDVTDRRRAEQILRQRDTLLEGVAAATGALLTCADFDASINTALRTLGRAAGVDRVFIYRNRCDPATGARLTTRVYEWCGESVSPQIDNPTLRDFPFARAVRWEAALAAGRPFGGIVDQFPPDEREPFRMQQVLSILCVPIMIGGEFWGSLGFHDCHARRTWGEAETSILSTLAGAIAGALVRQKTEATLQHDSVHDSLTGLPNRLLFRDRIQQCLERVKRRWDYRFAVLFIDLDRFKVINDSLGHAVGDKLLVAASERLARCVRGGDSVAKIDPDAMPATGAAAATTTTDGAIVAAPSTGGAENSVARLGGDEFTILLDDLSEPEDAVRVARRIITELSRPYQLDGHEVVSTPSIGIVTSGPGHRTAEDLLRDADAAMYRAKTSGKARYAVFDATMHQAAMDRLHMESDLRRAIERDELLLHYQPIISLDSGGLIGFEALLRWRRGGKVVSPGEFIPVAEDMGLIVPIGEWVIEQACRQLAQWRAAHAASAAGMTMSINLSRRQLGDARLIPHLRRVLDQTRIGPASVRLEITESVIMDDIEAAGDILARIKQTGVELSMDDFGTGYSSLICLHRFPIDVLKIDRGFLTGSADQRDVAAVVQAIVTLAHNLGMRVVAEGLEKIEQVAFCQALDCDFGQGYVFARPMPADAAEQFLLSPVPLAATA